MDHTELTRRLDELMMHYRTQLLSRRTAPPPTAAGGEVSRWVLNSAAASPSGGAVDIRPHRTRQYLSVREDRCPHRSQERVSMSASARRSRSHGGLRSIRVSALLIVAITITLLGGTGPFIGDAAAEPVTVPVQGENPENFESSCFVAGGQPFEIHDAEGGVASSVCEFPNGAVNECDYSGGTCTYDVFVHPTPSGPMGDVSVDPDDLGGVLDEDPPPPAATQPPAEMQPPVATQPPAEVTMEPTTEPADESATEPATEAAADNAPSTPEAGSQNGPSGGTGGNAADAQSGQSASGQEPASLTIVAFTCEAGYDPFALDADPGQDCSEPTDGVPFALTGDGTDTTRSAGDDGSGTARFEELAPGVYRLAGQPPSWGGVAFVHDCASSVRSFDDAAFFPLAMVGPTGTLGLTLMPSEALECGWYQVAAGD